MKKLKIRANAKINLSLSVIGKREDGYHELDTVMQSISLYDNVYITESDGLSVSCGALSGEDNIAYKAAKLFFKETKIESGADIEIVKSIPEAAGLGGGSADAAAVLVGLDKLYNATLSYEKLISMAVSLGADVPFLIKGGTRRARGIGEILEPMADFKNCYFIIAKGDKKPSTGEMFSRLDGMDYKKPDIDKTVNAVNQNNFGEAVSSFENSFSCLWEESHVKEMLRATNPVAVSLSGSGPAYFAVYSDKDTAESALDTLKSQNITAFLAEPTDKSVIFE